MHKKANPKAGPETAREAPAPRKGGQWWPDDWDDATVLERVFYNEICRELIKAYNDWPTPKPPPDPGIVARLKRRGWLPSGPNGDPWRMWRKRGCPRCGLIACVDLRRPGQAYCSRCP